MNIADKIRNQFPEFIEAEYPAFIKFVEHYYEFLESGELTVSGVTGTYIVGETIIGQTSGLTATVRAVDLANSRIFVSTQNKFLLSEIVLGQTSGAVSTYVSYRPNPIQTIEQLLNYRDIDSTVATFFDNFREEFMATIPNKLADGIDKRSIIKGITDLYREKGTSEGHRLFFKMLLDDSAELYYPSEDILDASDGKWSFDTIIRVAKGTILTDISTLVGRSILQKDKPLSPTVNKATAMIDSVTQIYHGTTEVLELNINFDSIKGTFIPDEYVYIIGLDSVEYRFTLSPLATSISITDAGQYYSTNEAIDIQGFNFPVIAQVGNVVSGYVKSASIITEGTGYTVGSSLVFDETNTNGQGTEAHISGVHGSVDLEDGLGEIVQEDYTVWLSGLNEDRFLLESGSGNIVDIDVSRFGQNYNRPPIVSATGGTGGVLLPNTICVGGISDVMVIDPGFDYTGSSVFKAPTTITLKNPTGTFLNNEMVNGSSGGIGKVVSYASDINLLKLRDVVGTFPDNSIITGSLSGQSGEVFVSTTAQGTVEVGAVHSSTGKFANEDGFVSSFAKRIHDGTYYQAYSYLVKTAESITNWRSAVKSAVHPAGFAMFGEINIISLLNGRMKVPTLQSTTYTPELFSTFKDIFHTVLRRRLGSDGYGTKNPNPLLGGEGQRDLTIDGSHDVSTTHEYIVEWIHPSLNNSNYNIYGSTLKNLDKWKFSAPPHLFSLSHGNPSIYRMDLYTPTDYELVSGTVAGTENYGDLTASSSSSDYGSIVGPVTYETWTHPDTGEKGTNLHGYDIKQFGHYLISDVTNYPDMRTNIPPPSEITYKTIP